MHATFVISNFQGATCMVRSFQFHAKATTRPNTNTITILGPEVVKAAYLAHVCQVMRDNMVLHSWQLMAKDGGDMQFKLKYIHTPNV